MLVHSVYFYTVPGLTNEQLAEFRKGVETLKKVPGIEKAYVGFKAPVPDRPVIEKGYTIALTVLCKDIAAHDAYQTDPIHLEFIAKNKQFWSKVQIFDSME